MNVSKWNNTRPLGQPNCGTHPDAVGAVHCHGRLLLGVGGSAHLRSGEGSRPATHTQHTHWVRESFALNISASDMAKPTIVL